MSRKDFSPTHDPNTEESMVSTIEEARVSKESDVHVVSFIYPDRLRSEIVVREVRLLEDSNNHGGLYVYESVQFLVDDDWYSVDDTELELTRQERRQLLVDKCDTYKCIFNDSNETIVELEMPDIVQRDFEVQRDNGS